MKLAILIFLISSISYAIIDHPDKICEPEIIITNAPELLKIHDCKMAQEVVKTIDAQNNHRNKVYDKLSSRLALQMEQGLEENALLDQYYSANNANLLPSGDSKVKQNCRLDVIGKIEICRGKINPNNSSYKFKLNLIKEKLKKTLATICPKQDSSLQEILNNKVMQIIGVPLKNNPQCPEEEKSCPIKGVSGAYALSSQFDNESAKRFIDLTQSPNTKKKEEDEEEFFIGYPQFKLIKDTEGNLKAEFISYLKAFNKDKKFAKEYINDFFFKNQKNKEQLSNTLANKCEDFNHNLETFLCGQDLEGSQLASLESPVSIKLFGIDPNLPDADIFKSALLQDKNSYYGAYGLQCLAKTQREKGVILNRENSVDKWFNDFTKNTRPQTIFNEDIEESNIKFCEIYNCENNKVKQSNACKNGGHISSAELNSIFDCDHKQCSTEILKYISYLQGLEKIKSIQSGALAKATDNNSTISSTDSKPRYSAFLENYLDVPTLLRAEGKEVNQETIAQKRVEREIAERKSDPTPYRETKITEASSPQYANTAAISAPEQQVSHPSPAVAPSQFEQFAQNTTPSSPAIKHSRSTKTSTNSFKPESDNDRKVEIENLQDELKKLSQSIANNNQALPTIADANSLLSPNSLGGSIKSDLSKAEQDRLAAWRDSLADWERRLSNDSRRISNSPETTPPNKTETENSAIANKNDSQPKLTNVNTNKDEEKGGKQAKTNASTPTSGPTTDSPVAIVSSEDLPNLKLESLKKLGINSKNAFIIKIRYQQKYYNVAVQTIPYNGKDILVPLLNESNKSLAEIVLKSPLFSDYKQFQIERQKVRQDFAQLGEATKRPRESE